MPFEVIKNRLAEEKINVDLELQRPAARTGIHDLDLFLGNLLEKRQISAEGARRWVGKHLGATMGILAAVTLLDVASGISVFDGAEIELNINSGFVHVDTPSGIKVFAFELLEVGLPLVVVANREALLSAERAPHS